ncbi:hypothetical protein [Pyrobaculum aerophilum]|uniref:hypothetical protein n=1 Tax=Pyrobaculum aerophilum TaxID=13773 RepID=UPI0023EF8C50|nr:hypothetical protein [Pyrobaculum aerophilum]MCX8137922.1 hypothetical protein [Pyrobaculum aerophilum]
MDAYQLFREFYTSLGMPLRALIEFKVRRAGRNPGEVFQKPWLFLRYVEEALGRHNAELISTLFVEFVRRRRIYAQSAAEALWSEEGWRRFLQELGGV